MRYLFALTIAFLALGGTAKATETLTIYTYGSFIADWGPGPAINTRAMPRLPSIPNGPAVSSGTSTVRLRR